MNGGEWNLLGTYSFAAGTGGSVTIANDGTNGYVVADAVKFEYVP
jgi:hyaluronate lyase